MTASKMRPTRLALVAALLAWLTGWSLQQTLAGSGSTKSIVHEQAGGEVRGTPAQRADELERLRLENAKLRGQLLIAAKLLEDGRKAAVPTEVKCVVIRLRHADAVGLAKVVQQTFNPATSHGVAVAADPATNALVVRANPSDTAAIEALVRESLDADPAETAPLIRTWIVGPLKNARASDVARVVREVYGRGAGSGRTAAHSKAPTASVSVDARSNSVVVACSAPDHERIKKLADELDQRSTDNEPVMRVHVVGLKSASAIEMAKTLRELYGDRDRTCRFSASTAHRLVIRCQVTMEQEIRSLIGELDQESGK